MRAGYLPKMIDLGILAVIFNDALDKICDGTVFFFLQIQSQVECGKHFCQDRFIIPSLPTHQAFKISTVSVIKPQSVFFKKRKKKPVFP